MIQSDMLYEGKCKKIFKIKDHEDKVWMEFKDNLTAFNGQKQSSFKGKGRLNRDTSSFIFQYLQSKGIHTHWIADQGACSMITLKLKMIPLEVVVRNDLAGSTAKKFQIKEGTQLQKPLFELYYKDEKLGDPFISGEQAMMLGALLSEKEELEIKNRALQVNQELKKKFSDAEMELIDFKLEFGKDPKGEIVLADEISADSCRIWKKGTKEKMDKDRFRLDLGNVEENYKAIFHQLSHFT